MNKILKSFFGLFLGAAFSLGVAASINANKSTLKETRADGEYYYKGNKSSWNLDKSRSVAVGNSSTWTFANDEQFLLCNTDGGDWSGKITPTLRGEPYYNGDFTGGGSQDIFSHTAGSYRLALNSTSELELWYTTETGSITIDLGYSWGDSACKIAVYFWNGSKSGWSAYYGVNAGSAVISIAYGLSFTPTNMKLVKYNSSYSESDWVSARWGSGKNAESNNLSFESNGRIVVCANNQIQLDSYPTVNGGASGGAWSELAVLSNFKINGSWHAEYYSMVNLSNDTSFKIVFFNGQYYNGYSAPDEILSNFSLTGANSDIHVTTGGTFFFFFDSKSHSTYITTPALMTAEWGSYFLSSETGMVCNAAGSITTNRWSALSSHFSTLSDDVQLAFAYVDANPSGGTGEQAAARYDYIIKKYGKSSFNDFAGRIASGKLSASNGHISPLSIIGNDKGMMIVIVISSLGILSIGAYYFFKKSKKAEE